MKTTEKQNNLFEDMSKNQLFYRVSEFIEKVGVQKYSEIRTLLSLTLDEKQIEQLNAEHRFLENKIRKKIRENPFELSRIENLYDDKLSDTVNAILKKGSVFIYDFLNENREAHDSVNKGMGNELFGYAFPSKKRGGINIEHLDEMIDKADYFMGVVNRRIEFSDAYKESLKDGFNYLISVINKVKNDELEEDFDISYYESEVSSLEKKARFTREIMPRNLFSGLWVNSVKENLRMQEAKKIQDTYNIKDTFKDFDSSYIKAYNEMDTNFLNEISLKSSKRLNQAFEAIEEKSQKSKNVLK